MASIQFRPENDLIDDLDKLPDFADELNRQTFDKVKSMQRLLREKRSDQEKEEVAIIELTGHMKNVSQELKHSEALCEHKKKKIKTEEHYKMLADRERGRLMDEIKRLENEIQSTSEQLNTLQNNIYRGNENIDSRRKAIKNYKTEYQEWLKVYREKEEDSAVIEKYAANDDTKVTELSRIIQKRTQQLAEAKRILRDEVTETKVVEIELEKTTEEFRTIHEERQNLLEAWERAIKEQAQKDIEIQKAQEFESQFQRELKLKRDIIDQKQRSLDEEKSRNTDLEAEIASAQRSSGKLRDDFNTANSSLADYEDEVENMRSTLSRKSSELALKRAEIINAEQELAERKKKLELEKTAKLEMKQRFSDITSSTSTLDTKLKQLQELLAEEEQLGKEVDQTLKIVTEKLFKKNQELAAITIERDNLIAEIKGSETTNKNHQGKIAKLDEEVKQQEELLYNQNFQIQTLQRKVRRAQGERTDEEREILEKKISELNDILAQQAEKEKLLQTQYKRVQEDVRQAKRTVQKLSEDEAKLMEKIDEATLNNDNAAKQLKLKISEKDELLVEEKLEKLELRKLSGALSSRADEVFSLENRQIQLQTRLEERVKEISIHNDMLRVQIKNADEERASASSELREREKKVKVLKNAFEIEAVKLQPEEGEEEKSQAFYVIKAAAERENLQRQGDTLDVKIRKSEKAVKRLEEFLQLMNEDNERFRSGLCRTDVDSEELQQKESLDQQYRTAMEKLKFKSRELKDLQEQLSVLENSLSTLGAEESNRVQACNILQQKVANIQKDVSEQDVKRERVLKQIESFSMKLRKARNLPNGAEAPEEIDFLLREQRELNREVSEKISQVVIKFPQIAQVVSLLYSQNGVPQPSRSATRLSQGSRSSSGTSVASDGSRASSRASNTSLQHRQSLPANRVDVGIIKKPAK